MDNDSTSGAAPGPASGPAFSRSYYYGWNLVGLSLFTSLFSVGVVFYTHGVFRIALVEDFGFTEGETLDIYALYIVAVACYSFALTPRMIERMGAKRTVLFGSLVMGIGFFLLGLSPNKPVFYFLFCVVISLGSNCMGMIASRTVLAFWFEAKRTQALSIAATGITAGGFINVPLATYLIEHHGWRVGYQAFGAIALVVALPVALWWKDQPQDVGLTGEPASYGKPPPSAVPDDAPPLGHKEILTHGVFLRLALSLGMASASWAIILQSLIADFREQGYTPAQATLFFTFVTAVILVGKPLYGLVGDRIDRKWAILWTLVMQIAALGFFLISRYLRPGAFELGAQPFDLALVPALLLFGIGVGGCQPLYSAYTADLLGKHTFVRATGIMVPIVLGCQLLGYAINGRVLDQTGTHLWMWYLMIGFYAASLTLLFFVPPVKSFGQPSQALGEAELAPSVIDSELIARSREGRRRKEP